MACVVCKLGDDCGPMQRTDCCGQPFHWNKSCARELGIRVRRGGPTGDLRCAPQCTPCGPPEGEGEPRADNWQLRLLNKFQAEREANDRLKRDDPAAYERGEDARADAHVEVLPLWRDLQGLRQQRPPRAR